MNANDEFFVLDSASVDEVESSLYGYVLDEHGVHTDCFAGDLDGNTIIDAQHDAISIMDGVPP